MKNEKVVALLESEETRSILSENQELLTEAVGNVAEWYGILNTYISENIEEFLEDTLEETTKNVYTFSTFATKQYLNEVSSAYGKQMHSQKVLKEARANEFC